MTEPEISVIVPTLDEASEIGETLRRAHLGLGPRSELIVVDGGSADGTIEATRGLARVLRAPACRGAQLAAGAAQARGDIFLFLHADTWLTARAGEAIRAAVARGAGAGCLRFAVRPRSRHLRYRLLERGVNWRTGRFGTATGDQAIFATREAYSRSGGVPPLPLFEDVAFVDAVKRATTFVALDEPAYTSRRRWEQRGFARTLATHWLLRAAYAAGADAHALARLYRRDPRAFASGGGARSERGADAGGVSRRSARP